MELTFLGTGTSQGVPMIGCDCRVCSSSDERDKRLRTSILLRTSTTSVVIDSGPDFRQQLLRQRSKALDAVVFTHEHKDHIAGLDDVRAFNYISGKPMDVYATERVQHALRREFAYVFTNESYPGVPKINLHQIHTGVPFMVGDIEFKPFEVMHLNLPVTAFRIGGLCYITDANFIPEAAEDFLLGAKVLVLNVLRKEKHVSHFCYEEGLAVVNKYRPEKAYFTHISHQLGLHKEVNDSLPEGIQCAYDGLTIRIDD
jgi:phosphoribosyl 1,2-cyclic phosphate phosphodiesterase